MRHDDMKALYTTVLHSPCDVHSFSFVRLVCVINETALTAGICQVRWSSIRAPTTSCEYPGVYT